MSDHRSVPITQSREWQMALDNLAQMHPQYLAPLLQDEEALMGVLERRVISHFRTIEKLRNAFPLATELELTEMAIPEHIAAVNPYWQDEEPLNEEQEQQLRKFIESQRG